jgi:hypothetical protein
MQDHHPGDESVLKQLDWQPKVEQKYQLIIFLCLSFQQHHQCLTQIRAIQSSLNFENRGADKGIDCCHRFHVEFCGGCDIRASDQNLEGYCKK